MHVWGDDFDWTDLYAAQEYISKFTKRYSGCNLCSKEKYGTIRYEWMFPPYGGIYLRKGLYRYWNESWLYRQWTHFGWYVCGLAIKRALKIWPNLEDELRSDFLAPTKFGQQCEAKYWRKIV